MNLPSLHSCISNIQNSLQSLIFSFSGSCVRRCQVHPEIFIRKDLEFVNLGSQRVIRVFHLPPQESVQTVVAKRQNSYNTVNDEVQQILELPTEEYWFTRSNRPFKVGDVCDCTSDTLADQGRISKTWRNSTKNVSEKVKASNDNARLGESDVCPCGNVYGKFAENFVQMVLHDVFSTVYNQQKCHTTVESKIKISDNKQVCYSESVCKNLLSSNYTENVALQVETVAQVHYDDIDNAKDADDGEKDSCQSKNDIQVSTLHSRDGIVNLSFSGTFCEPDDLGRTNNREDLLLHASQRNKFSFGGGYMHLEANKSSENDKSNNLVTDGVKNSKEIPDIIDQRVMADFRNESFSSKENCNALTSKIVQQVVFSRGNNDNNKFCIDDYIDKVTERKADVNRCWHSKHIQKPSLLFLHGAGSSADIWSLQMQYFSLAGYEVIAPDMLGHGYSSAPDSPSAYAFDRLLEDVLQIFDRYIVEHQKCVIIGHSYGSSFAAAVARYRPQQVIQLVLLSSGGPSPLVPNEAFFSFPSCIISLMRPFLMCGFKRDLFYGPRGKHLHPCCTYELPPYVLKHVERGQEWVEGDAAFHRRITVPTLLVHGLKDPYISLVEECEMERTIPRSFLEVISNAGHMLMLDTPEQLCHMIHSFITWWSS